jgi:3-dehydroquinate synthase
MQLPPYLRIGEVGEAVKQYLDGKSFNKLAILCDRRTAKDCLPRLRDAIHLDPALVIEIPEGEEAKTLDSCQQVWHQLTAGGFSRHDLLINLGGGMVTDLGGFCASTYKRGIDFIQIPTSLLAMVDASIGAKTGINFKGIKNHIGLFRDPGSVIIDIGFLDTLDDRQWWNGYAEMVKHAALQGSEALNQYLSTIKRSDSEEMIRNSLAFKWSIVLNDPNETGKRKI